jgi:hypothetical protein
MSARKSRKASEQHVRKVYAELVAERVPVKHRISRVASRIGYTPVGAARFLNRLRLQRSRA